MRRPFLGVLACLLFGAALAAEAEAGTYAHRHGHRRAQAASRHKTPPGDNLRPPPVENDQVRDWIASDPFNIMMRMGQ